MRLTCIDDVRSSTQPYLDHVLPPTNISQEMNAALPVRYIPRRGLTNSAATRIPQDSFSRIISYIASHYGSNIKRRKFGRLSLVCRYWASEIRVYMFAHLNLRSRKDALEFVALAKCSVWPVHSILPIGRYINSFRLTTDVLDLPWIHLILHCMPDNILGPTSDSMIHIKLDFYCLDRLDKIPVPTLRHVYHGLPRRFPPMMRPRFTRPFVFLSRLNFENPRNLLNFVFSAHRHFETVSCHLVKFTDSKALRNSNFEESARRREGLFDYFRISRETDEMTALINFVLIHRVCAMSSPPLDFARTWDSIASELDVISLVLRSFGGARRTKLNGVLVEDDHGVAVEFRQGQHYCNIC